MTGERFFDSLIGAGTHIFAACPNGGYICSPSDHFFFGDPDNIRYFVEACKSCKY